MERQSGLWTSAGGIASIASANRARLLSQFGILVIPFHLRSFL